MVNENGNSFALRGAMLILLKVELFQLSGHGDPHDDATPHFISDSGSSKLGLSNELSFISEFFRKVVKPAKKSD